MRALDLNVRFTRLVNVPKHTSANSPHTRLTLANMSPHLEVSQETMENINPYDSMIHTDINKAIYETVLDRQIALRNTSFEA